MRKPQGRPSRSRRVVAPRVLLLALSALAACSGVELGDREGSSEPVLGQASAASSVATVSVSSAAPQTLAFALDLDGESFELSLERSPPPTAPGYQAFRRTREGALVPLPPADLRCTYRGATVPRGMSGDAGFAALDVCSSATGLEAGRAARGVIRAGGRFWELWPDPADRNLADGVDHFAQPLRRTDGVALAPEPVRHVTLTLVPESAAPRLEFREGTDAETKYIDLIAVSDAARVGALGGNTEARTLQFVDTMNALLEVSGLTPRLRVTLRAQVLFDADPYSATQVGDEVDNDSLLNEFLGWAVQEELPAHDEHMLLSGLDFVGGVVGYAGLGVACSNGNNGVIVQAGGASGGFAVLSAVHEIGHTLGMNHDDGSDPDCPQQGFIMAAVGCGNCPGAEEEQFSPCSIQQFQDFLAGPGYSARCADDVPSGGARNCGNGVVEEGEACDCGADDCSDIDPCCDGAECQLQGDAECSDFNDGCCQDCTIVGADAAVVCRPQRSGCDIAEVCTGGSKDCPSDSFEPAGESCQDARGYDGACYFGDCRTRGAQCEQIADSQSDRPEFDNVGEPGPGCDSDCDVVVCGNGPGSCINIVGPTLLDGVPCSGGGQCVNQECVTTIDQCPLDPDKTEPGDCGCGRPDDDGDADGTPDCIDQCPTDADKVAPGACGCGEIETDSDADGSPDCIDECPTDAAKSEPGYCGCGALETDSDADGSPDCVDECPDDPRSSEVGACGCGVVEVDSDRDGTPDCVDQCPTDAQHTAPPCGSSLNASLRPSSGGGGCSISPALPAPAATRTLPHLAWLALALAGLRRRR